MNLLFCPQLSHCLQHIFYYFYNDRHLIWILDDMILCVLIDRGLKSLMCFYNSLELLTWEWTPVSPPWVPVWVSSWIFSGASWTLPWTPSWLHVKGQRTITRSLTVTFRSSLLHGGQHSCETTLQQAAGGSLDMTKFLSTIHFNLIPNKCRKNRWMIKYQRDKNADVVCISSKKKIYGDSMLEILDIFRFLNIFLISHLLSKWIRKLNFVLWSC